MLMLRMSEHGTEMSASVPLFIVVPASNYLIIFLSLRVCLVAQSQIPGTLRHSPSEQGKGF